MVPAGQRSDDPPREGAPPRPGAGWCVYILRCADGSLYTGATNDFAARLAAHRAGKGARYTRGRGPLVPVYCEPCDGRSEALRRERAIKAGPLRDKRALCAVDAAA